MYASILHPFLHKILPVFPVMSVNTSTSQTVKISESRRRIRINLPLVPCGQVATTDVVAVG